MPHGVDPKVAVIFMQRKDFPLSLKAGQPVPLSEHCTLGIAGCPCSILDLAEIIETAVDRGIYPSIKDRGIQLIKV